MTMNKRIAPVPPVQHGPRMRFEGGAAAHHESDSTINLSKPLIENNGGGDMEMTEKHGYSCPHGCGGDMKSAHGLARHIKAKHGGFGGLGKALKDHGTSGDPKAGFMGKRTTSPSEMRHSSYAGDAGGSYGKR